MLSREARRRLQIATTSDIVGSEIADAIDISSTVNAETIELHVNANTGNDSEGTGNNLNPFKTIKAAQESFTDESFAKNYSLILAPGLYDEDPSYVPKQFVNLIGAGRGLTIVRHNDDSTIEISYNGGHEEGESFTQIFKDLSIEADISITRNAVGIVPILNQVESRFQFINASVGGTLTFTGSGNLATNPDYDIFNFDNLDVLYSAMGNINLNAAGIFMIGSQMGTLTVTEIGVDMPLDPRNTSGTYVNNIRNSDLNRLVFTGFTGVQSRNTKIARVTLNGSSVDGIGPSYNTDAVGFPAGGAANNSIVLNTTRELTEFIFSESGSYYDVSGAAEYLQLFNVATGHYFWFNVTDGANTQTDPTGTGTGHQVDILSADTPAQIATKAYTAIAAVSSAFTASNANPSYVLVTNVTAGASADATATGTAAEVVILRYGSIATVDQLNKTTIINRLSFPVKVVTSTPATLNAFVDYNVSVKLDSPGPVTINLPSNMIAGNGFNEGTEYIIWDATGDAHTNPITINRGSTDTFAGGATSITINEDYGWRKLKYSANGGATGVWNVTGSSANPTQVFTSAAGAGGTATEALTLTGLLATDTILAVSQQTPGANNLPLLGYSTLADNSLTGIWSADPGAGAVIVVSVKR